MHPYLRVLLGGALPVFGGEDWMGPRISQPVYSHPSLRFWLARGLITSLPSQSE